MKLLRLLTIALLPVIVAACDSTTGPGANAHVGTYTLVSVDGDGLPADLGVEEGVALSLLSATMNLNADMTVGLSVRIRGTLGTASFEDTETLTGTYVRNGTSIQVDWADDEPQTFVYDEDDDELTLTSDGHVFVFRK